MGNMSKFYGAIIGAILMQIIVKYTGIDLAVLGVSHDFNIIVQQFMEFGFVVASSFVAGVVTYVFPANKQKEDL